MLADGADPVTVTQEWETIFRSNTHISLWPWSDLVSYVHRYATPRAEYQRVLEFGCGAGANIPFFLHLGLDYHAIEGSPTIVARLHERYPQLRQAIVVGDFTQAITFNGFFDLVVDRAAIQHNATDAVRRAVALAHERLRPGGKFIGIDWLSREHSEAAHGVRIDSYTRRDIPARAFKDVGTVHFFDEEHLMELLTSVGFRVQFLEHKVHQVVIPGGNDRPAWWNFVAVRS